MNKKLPEKFAKNRAIQITIGGVITIFLGAIGSGLWELFLSPLLHKSSNILLGAISSLFHGYVDLIYRGVSRNPSDYLAILPYGIIFTFLILSPWIGLLLLIHRTSNLIKNISSPSSNDDEALTIDQLLEKARKLRRKLFVTLLPLAIVSTFIYLQELIHTAHSRKAAIFIERSIEIVSPIIDLKTRLELRAQFRAIESAKDFYNVEDRLRKIARDNNLKLPEFESIR